MDLISLVSLPTIYGRFSISLDFMLEMGLENLFIFIHMYVCMSYFLNMIRK